MHVAVLVSDEQDVLDRPEVADPTTPVSRHEAQGRRAEPGAGRGPTAIAHY